MPNVKYTDSATFCCLENLKEGSLDISLIHTGKEHCPPGHICSMPRDEFIIHFDTYVIDVQDPGNALGALMFVLAIDAEKCSRN